MKADDWLMDSANPDPKVLWDYWWYNERLSLRKRYLFLAAVGGRVSPLMSEPACLRVVRACEEYADGVIDLGTLSALCRRAEEALEGSAERRAAAAAAHAFTHWLPDDGKLNESVEFAECAFGYAAAVRAGDLPADTSVEAWRALERYESFRAGCAAADREFAGYCRDVFGPNPFALPALVAGWRTGDVVGLARAIYADRSFGRLPLLADALMDAGCGDEQVLEHCRSEGPHVRGCWVVDLVLGQG